MKNNNDLRLVRQLVSSDTKRVLVLGDGNFSFARALYRIKDIINDWKPHLTTIMPTEYSLTIK